MTASMFKWLPQRCCADGTTVRPPQSHLVTRVAGFCPPLKPCPRLACVHVDQAAVMIFHFWWQVRKYGVGVAVDDLWSLNRSGLSSPWRIANQRDNPCLGEIGWSTVGRRFEGSQNMNAIGKTGDETAISVVDWCLNNAIHFSLQLSKYFLSRFFSRWV